MRIEVETVVWVDNEEFSSSRQVRNTNNSVDIGSAFDWVAEDLKITRERTIIHVRNQQPNQAAFPDLGPFAGGGQISSGGIAQGQPYEPLS